MDLKKENYSSSVEDIDRKEEISLEKVLKNIPPKSEMEILGEIADSNDYRSYLLDDMKPSARKFQKLLEFEKMITPPRGKL